MKRSKKITWVLVVVALVVIGFIAYGCWMGYQMALAID